MVVHGMERLLRRTMPVIVRPTPDEGVELTDDLTGGGLPMSAQIVMDSAQMPHHLALLWRRQDHAPIPAHGEAEEVDAVVDMDDAGLRLTQLQSTLFKKSGAGGSHPRALAEPDMTLSRHPAPIVRP